MELAPSTGHWTAAVAWARPWQRPVTRRQSVTASRMVPAPVLCDPVQEAAWTEAVAELRAAREALARLDAGLEHGMDPWLEAMARQDVFRARRKLRHAQEALTGGDADLPWSSC